MRKFLLFVCALLVAVGAQARVVNLYAYTYDATLTLQDGDTLTGSSMYQVVKVQIANHATVTLLNAKINPYRISTATRSAGISTLGEAFICLRGSNVVYGYTGSEPGIYPKKDAWLYIYGDGSLEVGPGRFCCSVNNDMECAAAIGAGGLVYENTNTCQLKYREDVNPSCGNIQIMGGRIIAKGGRRAAGIGGGYETSCGNIRIYGGTITATSEFGGAGIGAGYHRNDTEMTMSAHCGNIVIRGGTIDATGGQEAAGIGGGMNSHVGDIIITDEVTLVTATRGEYAPYSIGKGATFGDLAQATVGEIMIGAKTYTDGISTNPFVYPEQEEVIECIAPTNVRASEVTHESAKIRWNAKNGEAEWILTYRKSEASGWQFRYPVNEPNYTITGLEPNTEYEVELKAKCGDERYSDYSATFRFTTAAEPCHMPTKVTVYGISDILATIDWKPGSDNTGWRVRLRKNGSSDAWVRETDYPAYQFTDLTPNTKYWVSVRGNCSESDPSEYTEEISFTTLAASPDPETCLPPYGLTASEYDHESITLVWTPRGSEERWLINYKKEGDVSWSQEATSAPTGKLTGLDEATIYKIRVCAMCDDNHYSTWTDTYEIATKYLPCEEAQDLVAENITHNAATITWHYTGDYMQDALWRLEYAKASEGAGSQRSVQDHGYTTYTLEGLEPNTKYMIRIQTQCGGASGTSYTEWYYFTTEPEPCFEATNLEAAVTHNSATISWTAHAEDMQWMIAWFGEDGTNDYTYMNNVSSYTIQNLQPNTAYTVAVRGICDDYRQSDWASIGFVTEHDPQEGIESIEASDAPHKMVKDDAIFILRGGKIYTVTGQEVK